MKNTYFILFFLTVLSLPASANQFDKFIGQYDVESNIESICTFENQSDCGGFWNLDKLVRVFISEVTDPKAVNKGTNLMTVAINATNFEVLKDKYSYYKSVGASLITENAQQVVMTEQPLSLAFIFNGSERASYKDGRVWYSNSVEMRNLVQNPDGSFTFIFERSRFLSRNLSNNGYEKYVYLMKRVN